MSDVLEAKGELSQVIDYGIVVADLQTKVAADLALTIDGVSDKAGYKLADTRRKEWVKVRTGIDKRRKEMNAAAREHIKRVDAVAAQFTEMAGQAEDHVTRLVNQIDAEIARVEQDKLDKVFNDRNSQLQHVGINLPRLVIESLTDADIQQQIEDKLETDRLRKAEAERLAAEKAAAEKLAAEREEANRIEAEQLAAERADLERQKAEQAELQRSLHREQERLAQLERDRLAAEQQAERDRIAEHNRLLAEAERKEQERIESEAQAVRDADEARQRAATEEAWKARAEALRPDREKLLAFADQVETLPIPAHSLTDGNVTNWIKSALDACADKIRTIVVRNVM